MAVYGITKYGTDVYGYDFPPAYRVDPFAAIATDYSTISLSWTQPVGTIQAYRLVRNLYGYPVDQDDGEILIDSLSYPGSQYKDASVVPGTYYYYAIYVATNLSTYTWVRSGWTACLAIKNFDSYQTMYDLIPEYYISTTGSGDVLTQNNVTNTALSQFMQVFGWGMDLIKTQYNTYLDVNDPWKIPQSQLYNLGQQMGLNINPDIHPYTLRKAIQYNATVNQYRGTHDGIQTEVSALTGWNIDLQIAANFMLNNDQSAFIDPVYPVWSAYINYALNERVMYGNYWYKCIQASGNIGNAPTGTSGSNTWWQAVLGVNDNTVLLNPLTGNPNTWDVLYPSATNGAAAANSIYETIGVANPTSGSMFNYNSLQAINNGSAQNVWLRSIARTTADLLTTTTTFAPNKDQVVGDGIPVPYSSPYQQWTSASWVDTNQIVTYNNQPFIALRQSLNEIPPYSTIGVATTDWAPLSFDPRYRICISAYCTGSTAIGVTPFVEWYDSQGNFITRIFARTATPGVVAAPANLAFDSFTTNVNGTISGRTTDDGTYTWSQQAGTFQISPVNNGSVYPQTLGQRTYALINSTANTQVGVTFVTGPQAGQSQGIICRWMNDTHYIRADWTTLRTNNGGVWTTLGTFSSAFAAGDRMVIQLNGTSIVVLKNGVSVLSTTSSFNQTATYHGMIVENT